MITTPKNISTQIRSILLVWVLLLLFSNPSIAQTIQLQKMQKYSFLTDHFGSQTTYPDIIAKFMGTSNKAYFYLYWLKPGTVPSTIIGTIENNSVNLLDSLINDGISGELINLIPDQENNLIYSSIGSDGGIIKKIDNQGNRIWRSYLASDSLFVNPGIHILNQEENSILATRSTINFLDYNISLSKYDNETGAPIWKADNLTQSKVFYIPVYLKEFDAYFQVISSKGDSLNFAQISKEGELISSKTVKNPNSGDIFRYVNMDSLGHTYIGLNAWGYRCPKIDAEGQTVWHYIKPSPFGIEDGNRTTDILLDDSLNVYIGGKFRFSDEEKYPLILSKVNSNGNLIWESLVPDLDSLSYFQAENMYLHEDKIWIAGRKVNPGGQFLFSGAIACFDLNGNFLLYKDIEEFGPYGFALSMDFLEDEMLLTGSSRANPDSIFQHILHYKIDTLTTTTNTLPNQIIIHPYPNPTADWVSILQTPSEHIQELTITDMNGKIIPLVLSGMDNHRVNLNQWPSGIYIIRYRIEEQVYLGKVIKN